ncbi:MAG TPA: glycosyltransferase [Phycisphaerales bacterium]|nr:glycosyltransferase [Phycisphaerales bacterium]
MRVLMVYCASPEMGPEQAGGIAGYVRELALELTALGHHVGILSSGLVYQPAGTGLEPFWRAMEPYRGIDRLEVVNSPSLAPALWNFARADQDGTSAALDAVLSDLVRSWNADVVHVHSLEGLAGSCLGACRSVGSRVVMSLHNHHPFCPQVYLMRGRRQPCFDYQGGCACIGCEAGIDIEHERRRRAGEVEGAGPSIPPPAMPPIQRFADDGSPAPETAELWRRGHKLWRPLENEPPGRDAARDVRNSFGIRRQVMVEALSSCDRVLAVSDFVRRLAVSMGVSSEKVITMPIGSRSAERFKTGQPGRGSEGGLLRLVFLGFNNYYKGLAMLVDALGLLEPAHRGRVHLAAYGPGCPSIRERAEAIRPRLGGLELGGAYRPDDIPDLLSGRDVGVVPSVWWDNGPQTVMEFQSFGLPVLGANLGGIPDRVVDGVNGLLFRGNDRHDAARQIRRLLTEPGLVGLLRAGVRPGPTLAEHAAEVVRLYEQTLQSPSHAEAGQN